jgi:uncharacterized phage infection (PIP) family protein YhgE
MPATVLLTENPLAFYSALPIETQFFIGAILLLCARFHQKFTAKTVSYGPTILTTAGIFATFLGIALGLSQFDTSNIQASVSALLAGLKTAFWASVVGVGGALTLKLRDYRFGHSADSEGAPGHGEITAADLAAHLKEIQTALVGREEGSLITQMKLSRQDSNDRLDALKAAQVEALAKLSEMGSKALVEGLRDVIKDFNEKITEQFGDNFKQLNVAVGQLLVWQEQYKGVLETTVQRLNEITLLSTKATADYAELVERSGAFSKIAEDLGRLLTSLEAEKQQIKDVSEGLARLLRDASGSLPEVEKKIVEITTQLANAVTENQKTVGAALSENATAIRNSVQAVNEGLTAANTQCNKQFAEFVAKTKEQVTVLDAALSEELQKSLMSLGRQLTALSEKFVSDYTPLTDKLRRLVEVAR